MNQVVSIIGLGSLHQAHSTVLPGRRVTSLMLNGMDGQEKDKPSVHSIFELLKLKALRRRPVRDRMNAGELM